MTGMQGGMEPCIPDSHPHSDKYQVSYRYNYFSWWWANSRPKHVQKRNIHTKKNCAPSWLYFRDYTRMHFQKNIKFLMFLYDRNQITNPW